MVKEGSAVVVGADPVPVGVGDLASTQAKERPLAHCTRVRVFQHSPNHRATSAFIGASATHSPIASSEVAPPSTAATANARIQATTTHPKPDQPDEASRCI